MRRLFLFFGLGLGLFLAPAGATGAGSPGEVMKEAAGLLEAGDAAGAEKLYRELIASRPGFADPYEGLAQALEAQNRTLEAAAVLLEAGEGLVKAGVPGPGVRFLQKAAELTPDGAMVQAVLGKALLDQSKFRQAALHLRKAVELDSSNNAARFFLGAALWESGDLGSAEKAYRTVMEGGGPAGDAARASLGALLQWQGRSSEALPFLTVAAEARPDSVSILFDEARALEGAGRLEEAAAAYRAVMKQAPSFKDPVYRLARLLNRLGEKEAAESMIGRFRAMHAAQEAHTREAGLREAKIKGAWELVRTSRLDEAESEFLELGESVDRYLGLAAVHAGRGDHALAVRDLEKAILLDPERADLRRMLASERMEATGP